MNTAWFIAWRYFKSKKSNNIINIIVMIAVFGVSIGSAGLVVVVSGFNGIEKLVVDLMSAFDPELKIEAKTGKYFELSSQQFKAIQQMDNMAYLVPVFEEKVLVKFDNKQLIATMKGVDNQFIEMSRLDTSIISGNFNIFNSEIPYTVLGLGVASVIGATSPGSTFPIHLYVPRNVSLNIADAENAFHRKVFYLTGIFSIQYDFDSKYLFVPINEAQQMYDKPGKYTAIELKLKNLQKIEDTKVFLSNYLGQKFTIKTRIEQQEALNKILRTEKKAVFIILSFILIIATFNILGSLTIIILDKQKDIKTLLVLGAKKATIRKIYFLKGFLIALVGGIIGITVGTLLCLGQKYFGWIKIPGSFVMNHYPIEFIAQDFLYISLIILSIGAICAIIPARAVVKNLY
jgi:lipoprotein-releasing system permease protein